MFNLNTAFVAAIRQSDDILIALGATKRAGETSYQRARLFSTTWPGKITDEPERPYIIVTTDRTQRIGNSKDGDRAYNSTIRVVVVHNGEAELDTLCAAVEAVIDEHLSEQVSERGYYLTQEPEMEAGAKNYDDDKPGYFVELTYQCQTAKTND